MPRRLERFDAGPWSVRFTQVSEKGRGSRPVVLNARGKPVRHRKGANARLIAQAPEMYRLLGKVLDDPELMVRLIQGVHDGYLPPTLGRQASHMSKPTGQVKATRRAVRPPDLPRIRASSATHTRLKGKASP